MDYIEEKTTIDGKHIHKEVHESNGVKSIQITTDEGDSMDDPNAMMSKMIHEIMEDGPPPGGAPVHIQGKIEADP